VLTFPRDTIVTMGNETPLSEALPPVPGSTAQE
jgi:hypothetical protein